MKQGTTQQKKKLQLQRRIQQARQQLTQLQRNLQKLLAEEAKPTATDDSSHSPGA